VIVLYGISRSRALRSLWMLEELGLDFEHVRVDFAKGETREPDFLAVNPNGHVPALRDGELVLWESMAINLHLARKYDGGLWPRTPEDQSRAVMWSFWVMTELEPSLQEGLANRFLLPEASRDPGRVRRAEQRCAGPLGVLDGALAGREHLLQGGFGVADLNVASVLSWAKLLAYDLSAFPSAARWLDACLARPAFARARAR